MDPAESAVNLYRLRVDTKGPITFEEARDRLGLSDEEMRRTVDALNEAWEPDYLTGPARV